MRIHRVAHGLGVIVGAIVIAIAPIVVHNSAVALANTSCTVFPNCYDINISTDTQNISGVSMTANTAAMTLGDATSMNDTVWVETSDTHYPEIGLCAVNLAVNCGKDTSTSVAQYVVLDGTTT